LTYITVNLGKSERNGEGVLRLFETRQTELDVVKTILTRWVDNKVKTAWVWNFRRSIRTEGAKTITCLVRRKWILPSKTVFPLAVWCAEGCLDLTG